VARNQKAKKVGEFTFHISDSVRKRIGRGFIDASLDRIVDVLNGNREYYDSGVNYLFWFKSFDIGYVSEYHFPDVHIKDLFLIDSVVFMVEKELERSGIVIRDTIDNYIAKDNIITDDQDVLRKICFSIPIDKMLQIDAQYDFDSIKLDNGVELYFVNGRLYDMSHELVIIESLAKH